MPWTGRAQVHGRPGDVIFKYYLIVHNTSSVTRHAVYMRLNRVGHDQRWAAAFADALLGFDGDRAAG